MMKTTLFLKVLALGLLVVSEAASAQTRLILNGAKMNLTNGAKLVVANPNTNAITRQSGHIISEGQNNAIKWLLGTTTGSYVIPFGFGNADYLPVSFTKAAGTGNGNFTFSTYRTTWQNSLLLPAGITNFASGPETDNSANVLDRFWQLSALDYTTKPALTDLAFTYAEAEHTATGNTITESSLGAQRWNGTAQTWGDFGPGGEADVNANVVKVASVPSADLQNWWVLVSKNTPLPLTFLSFEARKNGQAVKLDWKTVNEVNCADFEVQRSADGITFYTIGKTNATGGHHEEKYVYIDYAPLTGQSYYRIKQNDWDGSVGFTGIRSVENTGSPMVQVYPNPAEDQKVQVLLGHLPNGDYTIALFDLKGSMVFSARKNINQQTEINFNGKVKPGMYLLRLTNQQQSLQTKLEIK